MPVLTRSDTFKSIKCSGTGQISKACLDNHDFQDETLDEKGLAGSYLTCIESRVVRGLTLHFFRCNEKILVQMKRFFLIIHPLNS